MRAGRLLGLVAGGWLVTVSGAAAQGRTAVGPGLVFVASAPVAWGFGPRVRWRLADEIGMATWAGLIGRSDGTWAIRGEWTLQLRFGSWTGSRAVWYASGGVAGVTGPDGGGAMVAGVGAELPVGRGAAWWGEIGVAGGARLAVGYQAAIRRPKR